MNRGTVLLGGHLGALALGRVAANYLIPYVGVDRLRAPSTGAEAMPTTVAFTVEEIHWRAANAGSALLWPRCATLTGV